MNENINKRIAAFRKLAGLNQTEAAEKMNMKTSTYSQMERSGKITVDMAIKLAEIFGIHPDQLFYEQTPAKKEPETHILRQNANPFKTGPVLFIPTGKEENIIKIIRNLPPSDRDEVINFINKKYQESKKK